MSRYKVKRIINWDKSEVCCLKCKKEIRGPSKLKSHITQAHSETKRETDHLGKPKGTPAWNKGLKSETDERVKNNSLKVSETFQRQIREGTYIHNGIMGEKARKELSERQALNNSGGKSKWFEINGQKVQGTYELLFAQKLEEQNIIWEKVKTNNRIFKYKIGEKEKSYAPDFYLPELDLFIEIKGFWWGNDEEKMLTIKEQHLDKRLIVIFGIEKLKQISTDIRNNLINEPLWSW